ncbi:MAG: DMT family transporter [Sphaerochaetaceae bacterium]|nr:DMT family transporter [Sphaerochaetaceae bacterium]
MKEKNAVLLLFLTSFIWGMTFVFQSQAADLIGPFMFNGIRMMIGFFVLLPFCFKSIKKNLAVNKNYLKELIPRGLLCGVLLSFAAFFQQAGLSYTTAGKGAFITALYILFVPLFGIFTKDKPAPSAWVYALMGLVGTYLMAVGKDSGINRGDIMVFICAFLYSFQIMAVNFGVKKVDPVDLSAAQMLFGGIICLTCGLLFEEFRLKMVSDALISILYAGIFSCGIAYTLQVVGQKYVKPEKASLVMCLESAWAALGSAIILGERMNSRELLGCLILFGSVVISSLPQHKS